MHALTQRSDNAAVRADAGASARAWVAMGGRGRRRHPVRTSLLGAGVRIAVAGVTRMGLGPVEADLTGAGLRRGYLTGSREALRRLDVRATHLIWRPSPRS